MNARGGREALLFARRRELKKLKGEVCEDGEFRQEPMETFSMSIHKSSSRVPTS